MPGIDVPGFPDTDVGQHWHESHPWPATCGLNLDNLRIDINFGNAPVPKDIPFEFLVVTRNSQSLDAVTCA
jgi:hypothetical protein